MLLSKPRVGWVSPAGKGLSCPLLLTFCVTTDKLYGFRPADDKRGAKPLFPTGGSWRSQYETLSETQSVNAFELIFYLSVSWECLWTATEITIPSYWTQWSRESVPRNWNHESWCLVLTPGNTVFCLVQDKKKKLQVLGHRPIPPRMPLNENFFIYVIEKVNQMNQPTKSSEKG